MPLDPPVVVKGSVCVVVTTTDAGMTAKPMLWRCSVIVCDELKVLSVITTAALRDPTAPGVNVTLIEQVSDGLSGAVQLFVRVKSTPFVPDTATPLMTSGALPM